MAVVGGLESDVARLVAGDDELRADPWPVWRRLRESGPVVRAAASYWITGYDDCRAALQTASTFGNDANRQGTRGANIRMLMNTPEQRAAYDEITEFATLFVVNTDDGEHDRLRRIAQRAFTPARIGELERATARYVDQILDELASDDVADAMQLAYRVPLMIIGDLLGVPRDGRQLIKDWSNTWFEFRRRPDDRILTSAQAGREFLAYVEELIVEHRERPPDGERSLIADLLGAEREDRMTRTELAAMFFVLLFAGHETTTNLIGAGLLELLSHRSEWEALVADPSLVPGAIDEQLRYVSPVQWAERVAREAIEVGGVKIAAGDTVMVSLACANRDSRVFTDPDRFDVRRPEARKQIAFAFGPHFCLGAHLARLEGTIALRALVSRFPNTELAADELSWRGASNLRGLAALPVYLKEAR